MNEFKNGLKDGIPIALGYFAVSFSFGILAIKGGLSVFQAVLTSVTNVTSAGQFAGLQIIIAGGTILEVILTQLIINLRYGLMSLSLTQKLADDVGIWKRLIIAFANTDEIFAVAMGYFKEVTFPYMLGLQILPILGMHTVGVNTLSDFLLHFITPYLVLTLAFIPDNVRYVRSSTITQYSEDYVMVQKAFGASKAEIMFKHVCKNVLLPVITKLGMALPTLVPIIQYFS